MIARITRGLAATALAFVACAGSAQTLADLRNDAATPGDVTTYGMGWSQQRHSPLKQIDPAMPAGCRRCGT
jgi:alcohol dehydrogenase (cytochrome c)